MYPMTSLLFHLQFTSVKFNFPSECLGKVCGVYGERVCYVLQLLYMYRDITTSRLVRLNLVTRRFQLMSIRQAELFSPSSQYASCYVLAFIRLVAKSNLNFVDISRFGNKLTPNSFIQTFKICKDGVIFPCIDTPTLDPKNPFKC